MASLIYTSCAFDALTGAIDFDTDTIKAVLVSSAYTANKDTHLKRSDVTNEVTGTGYTSGGAACSVTVTKNTTADTVTITLGQLSWPSSTITARGCVYYKSRGGSSSADELIAFNDFGANVSTTASTFIVAPSTITIQN